MQKFFYSPDETSLNTQEVFANFYSFDIGLVHYIAFHPYYLVYSMGEKVLSCQIILGL
jgi:hypothetical protein